MHVLVGIEQDVFHYRHLGKSSSPLTEITSYSPGAGGGEGGETRKETLGRGLPPKPSNPDAVEDKIAAFAALFN